jgi:hypothetical protein
LRTGGDQHLDVAGRRRAGADDAEVQAHFVERERDVLVGLGLDLQFHLFFAQTGRQHDLLGDHGRLRHRHHDLLGLGAALADHTAHGLGHLVELLDLAVGDPALLEGLGRKTLEHVFAARGLPSSTSFTLDELMSNPIIGGCLRPSNVSRKLKSATPKPHEQSAKTARQQPRAC